jgi:hypothetical protein
MTEQPNLEIPGELRTLAETSIEQARKALDSLIGAAHRAIDETEHRVDTAQGGVRDLSRKTIGFAEANVAASFDFAARLAKARTLDEWVKLHSEFAMEQTRRFSEQAKAISASGAAFAKGAEVKSAAAKAKGRN